MRKLSQADLFLLPSEIESFGLAALESDGLRSAGDRDQCWWITGSCRIGCGWVFWCNRAMWRRPRSMRLTYCLGRIAGERWGQLARIHAKKKYCANDVIPMYEEYYAQVLAQAAVAHA